MLTIDSLIQAQNIELASDLITGFVEECGGDCPKSLLARAEYLRGWNVLYAGMPDSALRIAERWIPQMDRNNKSERAPYFSLTSLKGACQNRLGKLDDAYETFSHLRGILLEKEKTDSITLLSVQISLGNIDIYRQKFHNARVTFLQSRALALSLKAPGEIHLSNCLNSLSYIARSLNEPEKAAEYLEEAIVLMDRRSEVKSQYMANPLINLGILYLELGKPDLALPPSLRAWHIFKQLSEGTFYAKAVAEAILGKIYADLNRPDSAMVFLQATEKSVQPWKDSNMAVASSVIQTIGEGYMMLGDIARAKSYLNEASWLLGADPNEREDFSNVTDHRALHYILMSKVKNFKKARLVESENYADSIHFALDQALALYKYLQQRNGSQDDRQITTELAYPLLEECLDFLVEEGNPDPNKVFELMELGKARLLAENNRQAGVSHFAGITDSIAALERTFDREIEDLQEEIKGKLKQGETVEVVRLQQELEKQIDGQGTFLAYLKAEHPAYYNLKYVTEPISLADAQNDLLEDEAQLSYFIGDSSVYLLVLRKDFCKTLRVELDFPLRRWVEEVRSTMYEHQVMTVQSERVVKAHADKYCRAAYGLYDKLVRPVENWLLEKTRIIPDGELSFIPFGVLLSSLPEEPENFRSHAYLIRRFQFSYSFSSTLHHQLLEDQAFPPPEPILVMAPSFHGRSEFKNLAYNGEEASMIQAVMDGEILEGGAATIQAFRERAGRFQVLHIASHAKTDDQNGDSSYIAFSAVDSGSSGADLLYARDIYDIPLRAEMVVLSACETGLGEWQTGEGILGLNRACMYAGAKCTVTSLWKVDDARTSTLVGWFYEGLREGLSKDAALRDAKLKYLRTESPAHPYYWASFIAIGDMAPLSLESNADSTWWVLASLLLLVVCYRLWRRAS